MSTSQHEETAQHARQIIGEIREERAEVVAAGSEAGRLAAKNLVVPALAVAVGVLTAVVIGLVVYVGLVVPGLSREVALAAAERQDAESERRAEAAAQRELDEALTSLRTDLDEINARRASQGLPPLPQPGPGEDELAEVVLRLVTAQVPTSVEVARIVTPEVLARIPDPTIPPEEIAEEVAAAIAANPPEDGEDGADATQEQVNAAVSAFCAENACQGPPGAQGPQGISPVNFEILRRGNGDCVLRIAQFDPATGNQPQQDLVIPQEFCGPPPPEDEPPPPGGDEEQPGG